MDSSFADTVSHLLHQPVDYDIRIQASRQVEDDLNSIMSVIDVIIPDELSLLKANTLQADYPLDPFDAIHLSLCVGLEPVTLISRDDDFIKIAKKLGTALTPEEFVTTLK